MTQWLSFRVEISSLLLLFVVDDKGCRVKDRYKHLSCSACGKVDEAKAVAEGIDFPKSAVRNTPVVTTYDHFTLMNDEGKALFEKVFSDEVRFQRIEGSSPLYIADPKKIVRADPAHRIYGRWEVPDESDMFRPHMGVCPLCKRFHFVSVRPHLYQWEKQETLVGVEAESGRNRITAWTITDEKARELKATGVRYLSWVPKPKPLKFSPP